MIKTDYANIKDKLTTKSYFFKKSITLKPSEITKIYQQAVRMVQIEQGKLQSELEPDFFDALVTNKIKSMLNAKSFTFYI